MMLIGLLVKRFEEMSQSIAIQNNFILFATLITTIEFVKVEGYQNNDFT
jgi:hypothetical protein